VRKITFCLSITLFLQCAVIPPEIKLTGEKTALENQIIGTYDEIENESWTSGSRRSTSISGSQTQQKRQSVLQAVQDRKFREDDINELKEEQIAGENNQGYVEILGSERYQNDAEYQQYVDFLIDQENEDRSIIYQRAVTLTVSSTREEKKIQSMLAKIRATESAPGTMIQQPDGTWIEKPKESKKKED